MNLEQIKEQIEKDRLRLELAINEKKSNSEILKLSERLDQQIEKYLDLVEQKN